MAPPPPPRNIGRYVMGGPLAVGGMASVHLGRLEGSVGFRRTVALKRMLGAFAGSPQAREMLIDEARLAARVHHGNVVQTLDVIESGDELFLVLEYVHGESLDRLLAKSRELGRRTPVRVATAVLVGALRGLHAAHEAVGEDGQLLELVHRDVSPHNLMVDVNGVTRVLDFGVARARGRLQGTGDGQLKGKLAYLAPEQVHGDTSRRSDVFTAGSVLWECLAGRPLFEGANEAAVLSQVLLCRVPSLASLGPEVSGVEFALQKALQREPEARFETAAQFADALEASGMASAAEVATWAKELAGEALASRERALEELGAIKKTVAQPFERETIRRALLIRWGSVAAIALLVSGGLLVWGRLQRSSSTSTPPPVIEPRALQSAGVDGAQTPLNRVADRADAHVDEPPVASAPEVTPAAPPRRAVRPVRTKKTANQSGCKPPYVIDATGVKRYKVECFK